MIIPCKKGTIFLTIPYCELLKFVAQHRRFKRTKYIRGPALWKKRYREQIARACPVEVGLVFEYSKEVLQCHYRNPYDGGKISADAAGAASSAMGLSACFLSTNRYCQNRFLTRRCEFASAQAWLHILKLYLRTYPSCKINELQLSSPFPDSFQDNRKQNLCQNSVKNRGTVGLFTLQ